MTGQSDSPARLLGLARRAGKLICGMDAVLNAIAGGRAILVIVAEDAAPATADKIRNSCSKGRQSLTCIGWGTTRSLAAFSGKDKTAVLAVCDSNFAAGIKQYLQVDGRLLFKQ